MKNSLVGIAVLLVLGGLIYTFAVMQEEAEGPQVGAQAPVLSLPSLDGKPVSLSDFKGKVVLVDFWATWCPPCQEEIPALVALHNAFAAQGFTMLGVSKDADGAQSVRQFLVKQPMPYPVLLGGPGAPPDGWGVPGLPTAYLIGRDGRVIERWLGEKDPDELGKAVAAALKEPSPAPAKTTCPPRRGASAAVAYMKPTGRRSTAYKCEMGGSGR